MSVILTKAKNTYVALRGFHTKQKLVVIESDDWGSIRMPSRKVFDNLKKLGDQPQNDAFLRNDSLETENELFDLFSVLTSVYDSKGRPAAVTANFATANPDFDNIDYKSGKYVYEPFYKTYDRYYPNNNILGTIKNGIGQKCFCPQLHCREHMNVNRWMKALQEKKADALLAFDNRMIGVGASFAPDNIFGYMDAFNTDVTDNKDLAKILSDGAKIFNETFGYQSQSFVASCFVWADELEGVLKEQKVRGIQSACWQNVPAGQKGEYKLKRRIRYTGQKSKEGLVYTVRNCSFEPSIDGDVDNCVSNCLNEIALSFKHKKPAIINSHRLNYIGSINPSNAQNNLEGLKKLLTEIVRIYPDVEFITTPELIDIINRNKNGKQ